MQSGRKSLRRCRVSLVMPFLPSNCFLYKSGNAKRVGADLRMPESNGEIYEDVGRIGKVLVFEVHGAGGRDDAEFPG